MIIYRLSLRLSLHFVTYAPFQPFCCYADSSNGLICEYPKAV